jgi:hypothetical protein
MACPFLLVGFDPRQVGALPRRPRLPSSRATGAAFFAEIVHRTISDRSSPPGQARFRASPRQARPDYRRQAWGTPLACGLKPSGNRTVKTLHRSVFSQSSGRAVSSLAAIFPVRFSPIVFGLHPVTPTPARHRTAMRCFHQSSSCPGARPGAPGVPPPSPATGPAFFTETLPRRLSDRRSRPGILARMRRGRGWNAPSVWSKRHLHLLRRTADESRRRHLSGVKLRP